MKRYAIQAKREKTGMEKSSTSRGREQESQKHRQPRRLLASKDIENVEKKGCQKKKNSPPGP